MNEKVDFSKIGIELDPLDVKILNLLANDSRMSYAEIAREVHMSRMSVRERVLRMVDDGIIERFTVQINSRKVGLRCSVYLNIKTNPSYIESVAKELEKNPKIESVYGITGTNALHVHAFLEDFSRVEKFIEEIYKINGLFEVEFNIMMRRYKSTRLFT
jgi:DNA-binding Lrp family transcriptional regulator